MGFRILFCLFYVSSNFSVTLNLITSVFPEMKLAHPLQVSKDSNRACYMDGLLILMVSSLKRGGILSLS